jgi:hypothetical protein
MRIHADDKRTVLSACDPEFANPQNTAIELKVVFEEFKNHGPLPFIAHADDPHEHGRDLFKRAMRREFGIVKPFPYSVAKQLSMIKDALCIQIDEKAEDVRKTFLTKGEGQQLVYKHKTEEALALKADTSAEPDPEHYPLLAASVGVDGPTLKAVAKKVLDTHNAWKRAAASVESARMHGKTAVKAAKTIDAAQAAFAAIKWPLIG